MRHIVPGGYRQLNETISDKLSSGRPVDVAGNYTTTNLSNKRKKPESLTSHKDLLPCVPIIPVSLTDER